MFCNFILDSKVSSDHDIKDAHERVEDAERSDEREGPVAFEAGQVRVAVVVAELGLIVRRDVLGGHPHALGVLGRNGHAQWVRHHDEGDRGEEHEEHDHLENVKGQAVLEPLALQELLAELVGQTIVALVFDQSLCCCNGK